MTAIVIILVLLIVALFVALLIQSRRIDDLHEQTRFAEQRRSDNEYLTHLHAVRRYMAAEALRQAAHRFSTAEGQREFREVTYRLGPKSDLPPVSIWLGERAAQIEDGEP